MRHDNAILLLGPTGSGKTPFGQYLEAHTFRGHRCVHFDFGVQLRAVAAGEHRPADLTEADRAVVIHCLKTGALLENEQFAIAAKILRAFASQHNIAATEHIVLNGLPRHVGQACDVDQIVTVTTVISLDCSPEVVQERIRLNTGGDRTGRVDDDLAAIARKLCIFRERTLPLIEHYRAQGVPIHSLPVGVQTTPHDLLQQLNG
ncbi:MAG: nucleoside monophosphate kinase [Bacillota bacterium]